MQDPMRVQERKWSTPCYHCGKDHQEWLCPARYIEPIWCVYCEEPLEEGDGVGYCREHGVMG
jgi:hypothetical protein